MVDFLDSNPVNPKPYTSGNLNLDYNLSQHWSANLDVGKTFWHLPRDPSFGFGILGYIGLKSL